MKQKFQLTETEAKIQAKCDAPLNPNKPRCTNPVHTHFLLKCIETGKLNHFLYLCRQHSGTDDEISILEGQFFDGVYS